MNARNGLVVAALAAMAGAAAGQEREIRGDFGRPLGARALVAPQASSTTTRSVTVMSTVEGDDVCEIRIEDGKVTCKINGKEVPADRIRKSDGRVTILGEDGGVVKSFQVWDGSGGAAGGGGGARVYGQREPLQLQWVQPAPGQWQPGIGAAPGQPGQAEPPRVMLGITMGAAPEEFIQGHDYKPDAVFRIERVIEGLAADRAGVRQGDIVIEIDGSRPASPERLREIMRSKEPGDSIRLKVLRDGEDPELTVRLQAYDGSQLGLQNVPAPDATQWLQSFGLGEDADEIRGAVREAIEEALKSLRSEDTEEAVREARKILEESLKEFEREGAATIRRFQRDFGGGGGGRFFFGNQPDMVFQVPAPPEPPAAVDAPRPPADLGRGMREETDRLRDEVERMRRDLADIKALLKEMQKNQDR